MFLDKNRYNIYNFFRAVYKMLQLQIVNFAVNSYLVLEGKTDNDHFYIIQQGNVRCYKNSNAGITPVKFGPGDFVGVVPCMSGKPQIETAIASTPVVAISVKKEQYPELIKNNTPVALKIIRTFANRMRVMNEMLSKATFSSVSSETNEQIFNVANYYEKKYLNNIAVFAYYQYLKTRPTGPNAEIAKRKFVALKPKTQAVYYEPTPENIRKYPKDTMIFSEAQSGHDMFIIQAGQVSITKVVNEQEITLTVLKQGDMFGEMALLENKPRSANAIAHTDCTLLVVNMKNFNVMVTTQPQMIAKLTTSFAERLWSMYRQIDNAAIVDPVNKMLDMLSLQIEKRKKDLETNVFTTDLSPRDLANMCTLPPEIYDNAIYNFRRDSHIRVVDDKIVIKDVQELLKQSAFIRSKSNAPKK